MIEVAAASNVAFFKKYGGPGCIGLVGGGLPIDRLIRRAQRKLNPEREWSRFSHAFVMVGPREDGHFWALESDLDFHRERVQLGVQENRVAKYDDEKKYPHVAVLDFKLSAAKVKTVLALGLELMANRTQYSLRELLAVYWSLRKPARRSEPHRLERDRAMFCSAFVQHLYAAIGIELAEGVSTKLTLPEDIAKTAAAHTAYVRATRG